MRKAERVGIAPGTSEKASGDVGAMPKVYSSGMRAVFDHADDPLAPMYVAHAAGPHKR
jgi:hypothetical protein